MLNWLRLSLMLICLAVPAGAQDAEAPIQKVLQEHADIIAKIGRAHV